MTTAQVITSASPNVTRVGVIGGGQLAWMMAIASAKLGVSLVVQTPHDTDPAVEIASDKILASINDVAATQELANRCDVITFENEFVDLEGLGKLAEKGIIFRPDLSVLAPLLDKYDQRVYLQKLGLPTPDFWELPKDNIDLSQLIFPRVLKARRHGYDGQGTFIIKDYVTLESILAKFGKNSLLLEEFVPFERELAAIACRSVSGEVVIYPIVETQQENQVCRRVIAPADISPDIKKEIDAIVCTLLNSLKAVGVFGIELFLTKEGKVLVNEIAPRTHNSGHFTIEACQTSQFEQHLRAVSQIPLGNPDLICGGAVMVNLLGYESATCDYQEKLDKIAQISGAHVHWYGKRESRVGRKLGHVTVIRNPQTLTDKRKELLAIAREIETIWYGEK